MVAGATAKLAPLAIEPRVVPPVEAVYQSIVLPAEVAFRLEELPTAMVEGVAVTLVGVTGKVTILADVAVAELPTLLEA